MHVAFVIIEQSVHLIESAFIFSQKPTIDCMGEIAYVDRDRVDKYGIITVI